MPIASYHFLALPGETNRAPTGGCYVGTIYYPRGYWLPAGTASYTQQYMLRTQYYAFGQYLAPGERLPTSYPGGPVIATLRIAVDVYDPRIKDQFTGKPKTITVSIGQTVTRGRPGNRVEVPVNNLNQVTPQDRYRLYLTYLNDLRTRVGENNPSEMIDEFIRATRLYDGSHLFSGPEIPPPF